MLSKDPKSEGSCNLGILRPSFSRTPLHSKNTSLGTDAFTLSLKLSSLTINLAA